MTSPGANYTRSFPATTDRYFGSDGNVRNMPKYKDSSPIVEYCVFTRAIFNVLL